MHFIEPEKTEEERLKEFMEAMDRAVREPKPPDLALLARERLLAPLRAENDRLRAAFAAGVTGALSDERLRTASVLRDLARRIGVAASPAWVRAELEDFANRLEVWARAEDAALGAGEG